LRGALWRQYQPSPLEPWREAEWSWRRPKFSKIDVFRETGGSNGLTARSPSSRVRMYASVLDQLARDKLERPRTVCKNNPGSVRRITRVRSRGRYRVAPPPVVISTVKAGLAGVDCRGLIVVAGVAVELLAMYLLKHCWADEGLRVAKELDEHTAGLEARTRSDSGCRLLRG
jgi:hypothetical protein